MFITVRSLWQNVLRLTGYTADSKEMISKIELFASFLEPIFRTTEMSEWSYNLNALKVNIFFYDLNNELPRHLSSETSTKRNKK